MTAWLRRAGSGRLPDDRTLVWSVAEGRRGRRWRSITCGADGAVALTMLMEIGVDGRFTRLELASPSGLLTLHPEPGGATVEGNIVDGHGVRPISLPWGPGRVLWVRETPIPEILTRRTGGGSARTVVGLAIDPDLRVRPDVRPGEGSGPLADERGVPILDAAAEWDLEA